MDRRWRLCAAMLFVTLLLSASLVQARTCRNDARLRFSNNVVFSGVGYSLWSGPDYSGHGNGDVTVIGISCEFEAYAYHSNRSERKTKGGAAANGLAMPGVQVARVPKFFYFGYVAQWPVFAAVRAVR